MDPRSRKPDFGEGCVMSDVIRVLAARIPDRDRLVELLSLHGHDARAIDEVEIDVHCNPGDLGVAPQIYADVENAVIEIGDPFVPIKHEGVIYVRPPIG